MRKAKTIFGFGIIFIIMSIVYAFSNIGLYETEPTKEMIISRDNQMAFIRTTLWSGIIMIFISIYLGFKAKSNSK